MTQSIISQSHFQNEEAAYNFVEARIWPNGPVCPHCGSVERIGKMKGKSTRIGTYKCYICRKPFTVKIGTIFEDSHLPLRIWLQAIYLLAASKKGISSNQLHRTVGCTLKTAWFLSHRIREAMREGDLVPFGTNGGTVESDETFIGLEPGAEIHGGYAHKLKVLSLIDRDSKCARSMVVDKVNAATLIPILKENIDREARVVTDEAGQYCHLEDHFADHQVVCHSAGEYVS
jgi:transposase-like protein